METNVSSFSLGMSALSNEGFNSSFRTEIIELENCLYA